MIGAEIQPGKVGPGNCGAAGIRINQAAGLGRFTWTASLILRSVTGEVMPDLELSGQEYVWTSLPPCRRQAAREIAEDGGGGKQAGEKSRPGRGRIEAIQLQAIPAPGWGPVG